MLVDATYLGDEAAGKKWNITPRTIENYRARLKDAPKLLELFLRKGAAAEGSWVVELRRALQATLTKAAMIIGPYLAAPLLKVIIHAVIP